MKSIAQRQKDRKKYLAKNGYDWDEADLQRMKKRGKALSVQVPRKEKERRQDVISNKKLGASYEKKLRNNKKWVEEFHTTVKLPIKKRKTD